MVVGDAPPKLGARARAWAEGAGWPLLAEPSSGARGGPLAIPAGPLLLGVPGLVDALRPERVVVVGRPTLTRGVSALLRRTDIEIEVRAARWRWPDAGRQAVRVAVGLPDPPPARSPGGWAQEWLRIGTAAAAARDRAVAVGALGGATLAKAVVEAARDGVLVVGSSLPVRDLDLAVDDLGGVDVLANRGVAGIDGTISTALGVALASPGRRTLAVLGDLTFLHDSNGLVLGPREPRPDVTFVVVDNGGGGIFATLEHGGADATTLERVFTTPVTVDFAALCAATGTAYIRVEDAAGLTAALRPADGIRVVHVPLRPEAADLGERLRRAVTEAVTPMLAAG
jgi:2-succinyl-5-enolpyruvyl-6-hydroxy-3-cyclohexene-1-carboxylate synthase